MPESKNVGNMRLFQVLAACLLVLGLFGPAWAQDGEDDGRERRWADWRNMSEEERAELRERIQERMAEREQERRERLRESLEMSAEEFAAVSPTIEKIRRLTTERAIATRMGDFARRRGGPGGGDGDGEGERPAGFGGWGRSEMSAEGQALASSMEALRTTLRDEQASVEDVKAKLAAMRAARDKLDQALAAARAELRGVLLAKQEALLVMQGVLD